MKRLSPAFLTMLMLLVVGGLVVMYVGKRLLAKPEVAKEQTITVPMAVQDLPVGTVITEAHLAKGRILPSKLEAEHALTNGPLIGRVVKNPITQVLRDDWRNILRGIGLRVAETAGYAVAITFMLSYLKTEHLADNTLTLTAICVASAIGIFATYNWGKATDKVGRRPIYLFGTLVMVVFAFPMFLLVNTGVAVLIVIAVVIAYAVCQNSLAGAQGSWFPELFNANTRSSGASMAYQFSAVVSGFTPFVVTLLYSAWGWMGAAALFGFYGLVGLIATLVTKETFGPVERAAALAEDETMRVAA